MAFVRKGTPQKEPKKDFKEVEPVDWKTMEIDFEKELGFGKYAQKTVEWVKDNDERYYAWMFTNNILAAWGLVKHKHEPTKSKYAHFVATGGIVWVGIREVEEWGSFSPFL